MGGGVPFFDRYLVSFDAHTLLLNAHLLFSESVQKHIYHWVLNHDFPWNWFRNVTGLFFNGTLTLLIPPLKYIIQDENSHVQLGFAIWGPLAKDPANSHYSYVCRIQRVKDMGHWTINSDMESFRLMTGKRIPRNSDCVTKDPMVRDRVTLGKKWLFFPRIKARILVNPMVRNKTGKVDDICIRESPVTYPFMCFVRLSLWCWSWILVLWWDCGFNARFLESYWLLPITKTITKGCCLFSTQDGPHQRLILPLL